MTTNFFYNENELLIIDNKTNEIERYQCNINDYQTMLNLIIKNL